ncbi:MAG TPA: coenzyme F420-0:L-glutamate ligase, partial [Anaerolineales bacterium]|nr:coenzyme F420-0:L-glutamate ligase [Anaerolineales bacterium]
LKAIPLIRQGDDLADIIVNSLGRSNIALEDQDIFVLAQKVVSKAEGRIVNLGSVQPGPRALELGAQIEKDPRLVELILQESTSVVRTRPGTIIVEHKLGFICANAGIDHSNVTGEEGSVLLLPRNPDRSADEIRTKIEARAKKRIGVMIIDSHGRAWRIGTVGVCIGLSGIPGVIDERGWQDLLGYTLRITVVGVADELAAAASLVMGQAAEGTPIVHVRGFPYPLREGALGELIRPKEQDLFR